MTISLDLNVLLDVAQCRPQFYQDSEEVLARARDGEYMAVIASHLITTYDLPLYHGKVLQLGNSRLNGGWLAG